MVPVAYALVYPVEGIPPALVYGIEYVPFALLLFWTLARLCLPRGARAVPG